MTPKQRLQKAGTDLAQEAGNVKAITDREAGHGMGEVYKEVLQDALGKVKEKVNEIEEIVK